MFRLSKSHIRNLSLIFGILIAAVILTYWILLWQASVIPSYVSIALTVPNGEKVAFQEEISVKVSPIAERVYILIHPHSTSIWFLQDTSAKKKITFKEDKSLDEDEQIWIMNVQFGDVEDKYCNEKFDILALASRDKNWLDRIRGRVLTDGRQIDMLQEALPSLNRSTQLVVTKVCK